MPRRMGGYGMMMRTRKAPVVDSPPPVITIVWSASDKGADQVRSNGNLTISSVTNGGRQLARTTVGVAPTQKKYAELRIESAAAGMSIGVCRGDAPLGTYLGGADESVALMFNGTIERSGSPLVDTGPDLAAGEYIGLMMDAASSNITFVRAGTQYGPYSMSALALVSDPFVGIGVEHNTATAGVTLNAGGSGFNYSLPSGYTAWGP